MAQHRWQARELAVTPEMIAGAETYNEIATTGPFIDDRGQFWGPQRSDDYLPQLRSALQVQWTCSRLCNFSCVHCFNRSSPDWKGPEADPFLVADRIIEARPYNACLCGGEPLVWKPLYEITRKLRDGGVPLVSAVTNGYLATPERIKKLLDAGLTNLQISLDGIMEEQFRELRVVNDGLARASEAVKECLKHDWRGFSLSFTPTRHNIASWKEFCHYWADQGVTHIRTQPFMPIGRGKEALDLMPTDEDYQRFHVDTRQLIEEIPHCFIDWGDPLEHLWFYAESPAYPWCCGIQADGWYELSCYIPVLLGSSLDHSVEEFWAKDLKKLWQAPVMKRFAETMKIGMGMAQLELPIYDEESLHIDIFDDDQLEIFLATDDLEELKRLTRQNLGSAVAIGTGG